MDDIAGFVVFVRVLIEGVGVLEYPFGKFRLKGDVNFLLFGRDNPKGQSDDDCLFSKADSRVVPDLAVNGNRYDLALDVPRRIFGFLCQMIGCLG